MIASALRLTGIEIGDDLTPILTDQILNFVSLGGTVLAIYGRVIAIKRIAPTTTSVNIAGLLAPLAFLPLALGALSLQSCATVQSGNAAIVVQAEKSAAVAADAFDTFLKTEGETRAALQVSQPAMARQTHAFAEYLRAPVGDPPQPRGKAMVISVRRATSAYKLSRTPENKATLSTYLATLQGALGETERYLVKR